MLPKKAAAMIAPKKLKGKLKGKFGAKPPAATGPGGPSVPPGAPKPVLKAGMSKKLKGMG